VACRKKKTEARHKSRAYQPLDPNDPEVSERLQDSITVVKDGKIVKKVKRRKPIGLAPEEESHRVYMVKYRERKRKQSE
jgi:hypothetical protein